MRIAVREIGELDHIDIVHRPLFGGLSVQRSRRFEREGDVLQNRLPRQQLIEFLEHHDAVRARLFDQLALQTDRKSTRFRCTPVWHRHQGHYALADRRHGTVGTHARESRP